MFQLVNGLEPIKLYGFEADGNTTIHMWRGLG